MEQKSMIFLLSDFQFWDLFVVQTNIKLEKNDFSRYQAVCQKSNSNQDKNKSHCKIYDS